MVNQNFGTLLEQPISQSGFLSSLLSGSRQNIYQFEIADSPTQTHNLSLRLHDILGQSNIDIDLYADTNNNGILDNDDQRVAYSYNTGTADESIDYSATAGTYFAQIAPASSIGFLSTYTLDIKAAPAVELVAKHAVTEYDEAAYDIGVLGNDRVSRDRFNLSAVEPIDIFEFSVSQYTDVTLHLHSIDNGDADLWLYKDVNENGMLDIEDDFVGSSFRDGYGIEENITYRAEAGTYFAEVARYDGSSESVSYNLDFSAVSTVPATFLSFDAERVFALSSNPNADHTIYLDFDGHITTGTEWNAFSDITNSFETAAYDTDGNANTFSLNERFDIWTIWQRVAEDFAPFNVNVTTLLPNLEQLTRTGEIDTQWGIRAVIGGSGDWLPPELNAESVLGIAGPDENAFNYSTDTPVFAFSDNHLEGESIAETISHEVGHSLGLSHDEFIGIDEDGRFVIEEYYAGNESWAPIMGRSDLAGLSQWDQGEYLGAQNREGDLDIITGLNGFGYRADDHSDYFARATELSFNGDAVEAYGIVETNEDWDVFSFTSTGSIALEINPFIRGANLDILAGIYDADGLLIDLSDRQNSLGASFVLDVDPGVYYVGVTGTGQGDPLNGGYSGYGSIGQYSIEGAIA